MPDQTSAPRVRTTLDTRLERLLYQIALNDPDRLDVYEREQTSMLFNSVTAGLRAQALALEFAREQIGTELCRP